MTIPPWDMGPIAPERNPPIHPEYYQPRVYFISNISLGATTTVTTSEDNDYVVGQLVRFLIPPTYRTIQLSEQEGYVISRPTNTELIIGINSIGFNPFNPSPAFGPTKPQIMAVGDINTGQINTGRTGNLTYIPGSFINISPQ